LLLEAERHRPGRAAPVLEREQHRRADGRMPGEGQLATGREDPQPRSVAVVLGRQHEHRFGEVELFRDRLHAFRVEAF
jgi:hypothetical protein